MTPNNRLFALAASALVLTAAPKAYATLAAAATFEEKVENAASIVLGKCIKSETRMDATGRWMLTYATFEVEQAMKGTPPKQITIVTPGGQVGSVRQDTIGIPQFREGDESVLFVKNSQEGLTVLYFDQGAYEVTKNDRGERIVAPVPTTVVHVDSQRGMAVPPEMPRTLREFSRGVDETLASARERHMRFEMIEAQKKKQQEASLGSILARYKFIIGIALVGIAFATWRLVRR